MMRIPSYGFGGVTMAVGITLAVLGVVFPLAIGEGRALGASMAIAGLSMGAIGAWLIHLARMTIRESQGPIAHHPQSVSPTFELPLMVLVPLTVTAYAVPPGILFEMIADDGPSRSLGLLLGGVLAVSGMIPLGLCCIEIRKRIAFSGWQLILHDGPITPFQWAGFTLSSSRGAVNETVKELSLVAEHERIHRSLGGSWRSFTTTVDAPSVVEVLQDIALNDREIRGRLRYDAIDVQRADRRRSDTVRVFLKVKTSRRTHCLFRIPLGM